MFRIRFEPKGGFWVVEICTMWLVWTRVRDIAGPDASLRFDDFSAAVEYVIAKGIDKVYRNRTAFHPVTGHPDEIVKTFAIS